MAAATSDELGYTREGAATMATLVETHSLTNVCLPTVVQGRIHVFSPAVVVKRHFPTWLARAQPAPEDTPARSHKNSTWLYYIIDYPFF
jgi:hypothetical protein